MVKTLSVLLLLSAMSARAWDQEGALGDGRAAGPTVFEALSTGQFRESLIPDGAGDICQRRTGEIRILVLMMTWTGAPALQFDAAQVREAFFGEGAESVSSIWRENSRGKTWATGEVMGPFKVEESLDCTRASVAQRDLVLSLRNQVDLNSYDRVVWVIPNDRTSVCYAGMASTGCSFRLRDEAGQAAFTGGTVTLAPPPSLTMRGLVGVAAHELGHNFGLHHSNMWLFDGETLGYPGQLGWNAEYGGLSSLMGVAESVVLRQGYNALELLRLGWLGTEEVLEVSSDATVSLKALHSQGDGTRLVKVRRSVAPETWLYLEFQSPSPAEDPAIRAKRGISVYYDDPHMNHFEAGFDNYFHPAKMRSFLLNFGPQAKNRREFGVNWYVPDPILTTGSQWLDPYSPLRLRVVESSEEAATVEIAYRSACAELVPERVDHGEGEEAGTLEVRAPADCQWSVSSAPSWIRFAGSTSGTGSGVLSYQTTARTEPVVRDGAIAIANRIAVVRQFGANRPPATSGMQLLAQKPSTDRSSWTLATIELQTQYEDPNGAADLRYLTYSIAESPMAAGGCTVVFDRLTDSLYLLGDNGVDWLGPQPRLNPLELRNRRCWIRHAALAPMTDGSVMFRTSRTGVSLTTFLDRSIGLVGRLPVWLMSEDARGLQSEWRQAGTVDMSAYFIQNLPNPNRAPALNGTAWVEGSGRSASFNISAEDPDGATDIARVEAFLEVEGTKDAYFLRVNLIPATPPGYLIYDGYNNAVVGESRVLKSNLLQVSADQVKADPLWTTLTVELPVQFDSRYAGSTVLVSAQVTDRTGARGERTPIARWTIPQ